MTEESKEGTVTNCVPGFYYALYGWESLEESENFVLYGPELCGESGEVTFPEVTKPSDAAGFFSFGVKATSAR